MSREDYKFQPAKVYMQKKTFTQWCNSFLAQEDMSIDDLFTDLADGKKLMKLLEIISGEKIGTPGYEAMDNINRCICFLTAKDEFEEIDAQDIIDNNPPVILRLIWTIIFCFRIKQILIEHEGEESSDNHSAINALLLWCQRTTHGYRSVDIQNFHNSWRDGMGFNALIHSQCSDLINYDDLQPNKHITNLSNAFNTAEKEFGIHQLLDVEDMDQSHADEKSIMTYLADCYHYFDRIKKEKVLQFNQQVNEVEVLLDEAEQKLAANDYGNDIATVKSLLSGHRDITDDIKNIQEIVVELKEFANDFQQNNNFLSEKIMEKAVAAYKRYQLLAESCQKRHDNLKDRLLLYQYNKDVEDELSWVSDKYPIASSDDLGTTLTEAQNLLQKHQVLESEFASHDGMLVQLSNTAHHMAAGEVQQRIADLRQQLHRLKEVAAAQRVKLKDAVKSRTLSLHRCSLHCSQHPSNIQLACDGLHVALPTGGNEVAIWDLHNLSRRPLELRGHQHPPAALRFSHRAQPTMLCTGAKDYVLLWNIDKATHWTGERLRGKVIGISLGAVTSVSFSHDDALVAACAEKIVFILETGLQQEHVLAKLKGHKACVNCAEFCPHDAAIIVTAGDDRTFRVWDFKNQNLVYESSIISSSPFLSMSMNLQLNNFVIGTSDGQIHIYDLTDGNGFRHLQHLDVKKMQDKLAEQTQSNVDSLADKVSPESTQVGAAILALRYTATELTRQRTPSQLHQPFQQREDTLVSELLHNAPMLAIATTGAIMQVNTKTQEASAHVLLKDPMKSCDTLQENGEVTLCMAGNMALAQNTTDPQLWALVGNAFSNQVDVISVGPPSEQSHNSVKPTLSVIASGGFAENSPLLSEMVLRYPRSLQEKYTKSRKLSEEYPMECDPPIHLEKTNLDVADIPIRSCTFSGDGRRVACGLGNDTVQVFSMPHLREEYTFAGHSGAVNSVYWNCSGQWLLSSSEDRTAALWSIGHPDPLLTFTNTKNNTGHTAKDNPAFSSSIKFGQFYYMDKFILLTCGNKFYMYNYHLSTDNKRNLAHNQYELVQRFKMTQAKEITAFSAVSEFYSYLALCAGSNHCIEVFDLNVGRSVLTIPDAHIRSVHAIKQNQGSSYVRYPMADYDLFVTAASDCIKLWDLRSARCVGRYEGQSHAHHTYGCGLDISPCARFIASGSEDKSAYIFDIRSGTYLHKLTGHTDTVGQVAFHPVSPLLLTSTLDGRLRLYSNKMDH